ncbi:MAG: hypothetical protein A3F84_11070 [Candidatus Handelsmanbacteria bacterium RIFCSPLOWO2_12_FULL_64_10]|uniref:Uncharacterized protein n=1 Tax=Handelsmanbacteria sp. (strain RIFCSPLOWO2_12_FULL_64_10) TaxID=1817868 RepID=A0A1F6D1M7_HANXR|nr:MAG: hypothetical protein A3F84_11070 [Candidatus Handelsmanbacteria bacterium RIFCSPLOWO2_12_FULL_64_10]
MIPSPLAMRSSIARVVFVSARSIWPRYFASMPARSARAAWVSPSLFLSLRTLSPSLRWMSVSLDLLVMEAKNT